MHEHFKDFRNNDFHGLFFNVLFLVDCIYLIIIYLSFNFSIVTGFGLRLSSNFEYEFSLSFSIISSPKRNSLLEFIYLGIPNHFDDIHI
jgi:hypothetical protein